MLWLPNRNNIMKRNFVGSRVVVLVRPSSGLCEALTMSHSPQHGIRAIKNRLAALFSKMDPTVCWQSFHPIVSQGNKNPVFHKIFTPSSCDHGSHPYCRLR